MPRAVDKARNGGQSVTCSEDCELCGLRWYSGSLIDGHSGFESRRRQSFELCDLPGRNAVKMPVMFNNWREAHLISLLGSYWNQRGFGRDRKG